jgi:hypothetical protein
MQEFESISASSYDPSALATKLTAKAAEGWSVVAIVPTGGDVTAYLSRERDGAGESKKAVEKVKDDDTSGDGAPAESAKPEPEPVKIEPEPKAAVAEPSGWAIAPEPATPAPEPVAEPAAPSIAPTPTPAAITPAAAGPAAMAPTAAAAPAAAAAAPAAAATPAPAVPAGWYADPAGRFELRYWDGSTWTEHVSRAGQQFTDPPVA